MSKQVDAPQVSDQVEKEWCFVWPSRSEVVEMLDTLRKRIELMEAGWTLEELAALDRWEEKR